MVSTAAASFPATVDSQQQKKTMRDVMPKRWSDPDSNAQQQDERMPERLTVQRTEASFKTSVAHMVHSSQALTHMPRPSMQDGVGSCRFEDGSTYEGDWLHGVPHGRGKFAWPSGECFEGEWQAGMQQGVGAFTAADGSTYVGFWQHGQQHGEGVYKPAGPANKRAEVIFMQAYRSGTLMSEQVLRVADLDVRRKEEKKKQKRAGKDKEPEPLLPRPGEVVYKGHRSYDLIRQLQLGIMFSIAQQTLVAPEDMDDQYFHQEVTQYFPGGSTESVHPFKWKDYAPAVFQRVRQLFGIVSTDYLLSLAGDASLRQMSSPGKSGSIFFLSEDDRFLIKTVTREEMQLLMEMIPLYYRHVEAHPDTLLTRFYGVHRVQAINGRGVRFVVMGNVFPTDVRLHRKYDLKGSSYKRTAGLRKKTENPNAVLKDLDLDLRLLLDDETHKQLMSSLQADCELLKRLFVMDYSLLLGVHYVAWGNEHWYPPQASREELLEARKKRSKRVFSLGVGGRDPSAASLGPVPPGKEVTPTFMQRLNCFSPRVYNTKNIYRTETFRPDGRYDSGDEGGPSDSSKSWHHAQESYQATAGGSVARSEGAGSILGPGEPHHDVHNFPAQTSDFPPSGSSIMEPSASSQPAAEMPMPPKPLSQPPSPPQRGPVAHSQTMPRAKLPRLPPHKNNALDLPPASSMPAVLDPASRPSALKPRQNHTTAEGPSMPEGSPIKGVVEGYMPGTPSHQRHVARAAAKADAQHLLETLLNRQSTVPPSRPGHRRTGSLPSFSDLAAATNSSKRQLATQPETAQETPVTVVLTAGPLPAQEPVTPQGPSQGPSSFSKQSSLIQTRSTPEALLRDAVAAYDAEHVGTPVANGKSIASDSIGDSSSRCPEGPLSGTVEDGESAGVVLANLKAQSTSFVTARGSLLPNDAPNLDVLLGPNGYTPPTAETTTSPFQDGIPGPSPLSPLSPYHVVSMSDRFGSAVPAVALSHAGHTKPQAVLLYLGIIDFLQNYNMRKRLEHFAKATVIDGSSISVVHPTTYSRRFMRFMNDKVFVKAGVTGTGYQSDDAKP